MPPHPEFPPSADIVDMDVMMALMVASLCGRMFTLPDEPSVPFERTQPSWRLLTLFTSERWAEYAGAEAGELWPLVDAKAKELWGFTIEEELLQDWETEGRLVAEFRARHSDAPVVRAFEKYHSARKRVIDDFIASPTNYTSTAGYWKTVNEGDRPPSGGPGGMLVQGRSGRHPEHGRRRWSGFRSRPCGEGGHEDLRRRCLVVDGAVWAHSIVMPSPALDNDLRLSK